MNSPGHRANILNPSFGRVGNRILDGGFLWTYDQPGIQGLIMVLLTFKMVTDLVLTLLCFSLNSFFLFIVSSIIALQQLFFAFATINVIFVFRSMLIIVKPGIMMR